MERERKYSTVKIGSFILSFLILITLSSCATVSPPPEPEVKTQILPPEEKIKEVVKKTPPKALPPIVELKPKVATEEKMPFEEKLFSLSTRSAPLQDVLLGLAKEAGLNLVLEKGVDPNQPVSVEIKDLSLKKALDMVLSAYEYFYDIDGNILRIKALETRMFQFDYPLLSNRPETDIGGDVLGGGGGGGGGGTAGTTNLSGEFSIEADVDEEYLDIWQQIEDALQSGERGEGGLLSEFGRAQINRMAGTIIVTDRRENLLLVERYLNELEKSLKRQVVIEAKIIEVNLNKGHQYGIDWEYVKDTAEDFYFRSNLLTNTSGFNIGVIGAGGEKHLSFMLDAISTSGTVNVLSAPRLNVLNNQTALISVGRAIPYLQWELRTVGTTTTTGATVYEPVPTVVRSQAGVTLGVTPQISEDGVTTLHIVPIITDLVEYRSFSFQNNTFDVPVIDIRETDTIVRVRDGETVVIGGLIQDKNRDNYSKIPILGDIPFLGKAFSQQIRSSEKVELVILLTLRIVEQ